MKSCFKSKNKKLLEIFFQESFQYNALSMKLEVSPKDVVVSFNDKDIFRREQMSINVDQKSVKAKFSKKMNKLEISYTIEQN